MSDGTLQICLSISWQIYAVFDGELMSCAPLAAGAAAAGAAGCGGYYSSRRDMRRAFQHLPLSSSRYGYPRPRAAFQI